MMKNQPLVTDIAALQMLEAEESSVMPGNTCSPSFTCKETTCSETVVENVVENGDPLVF
jgi:hypothetical protein